jgi:hypothetical protein
MPPGSDPGASPPPVCRSRWRCRVGWLVYLLVAVVVVAVFGAAAG